MKDLDPALIAALKRPEAYAPPAAAIEHIETHISHVFLAGDFAYKLKKPVDFGFLDFSTLDKRRAACAEELRLNRRLAPDFYLDVVPVCRGPGGFRFSTGGCRDGESEIEVAVRMRRFPQDALLDALAQRGELTLAHMTDIARQLARFHATAQRGPEIDRYGQVECVREPVMQNFTQTEPYIGRSVGAEKHAELRSRAERFLATHAERFAARIAQGRIVDGHGDLHLRNMFLDRNRIVVFDCIEFNPALRAGDAMNDIAFLVMDLLHRGLPAHANRFLND
ncbi:MAG: phosphotransferase, partial [Gammaproteobacteria bacterium]|nr:phosphotransferase [Gammaproteobacteria bacterium]